MGSGRALEDFLHRFQLADKILVRQTEADEYKGPTCQLVSQGLQGGFIVGFALVLGIKLLVAVGCKNNLRSIVDLAVQMSDGGFA